VVEDWCVAGLARITKGKFGVKHTGKRLRNVSGIWSRAEERGLEERKRE